MDAATWKTRLRCALNKSPEFQEVPQRSQLDIVEPYKVYRIVPPDEQGENLLSLFHWGDFPHRLASCFHFLQRQLLMFPLKIY